MVLAIPGIQTNSSHVHHKLIPLSHCEVEDCPALEHSAYPPKMHLDLKEAFTKVPKKNSSTVKEKEVTLFDEDDTPRKHSGRRIRYASPPPKPYPGSVIKPDYHKTLDARECKLAACKTHGKTPIPPAV
jgi:hypothetical protein